MAKPKVIVFSGYGFNCEEETKYAFDYAGGVSDIVHINDVADKRIKLSDYQILALGGGFAYGDDTGAGIAYANKMRNHIWEELMKFVQRDKLVIGICNGFQVLVNLGLVPAIDKKYGERQVGLMNNESARYTVRFIDLQVESKKSPWYKGMKSFSIPVANGEGKLFAEPAVMKKINNHGLVGARYFMGEMSTYLSLPYNPNGSIEDIASLTDETGRVMGLMPHPERAMFFTQLPNWELLKEKYKKEGKKIPTEGPGMQIFKNGINYFK
ncbi:MAG: phosphoribosylformylglycinamidine synthase subunit PurQ [Candidatus Levyibacteriota bacterium]